MSKLREGAPWILLGAFFAFMLAFGAKYHPIEEVNSAEWDGYVAKADALRHGTVPRDAFHPLLYPIAAAGAGAVLGDTFAGARAVSSLFATLFVGSAFLIGRRCFSRSAGWFAALATALNYNVLFMGVHAASDMMFAALSALTVVAGFRALDDARLRAVVPMAILFALAWFTRYTAIALLPALVVPVLFGATGFKWSRRFANVGVFVVVCGVTLIPHFVLTDRAFGHPFVNESWKNLAFKLYGDWDWGYLKNTPFEGASSVVRSAPLAFVGAAARELCKFAYLTLPALGGFGLAGGLFSAGTVVGAYATLWNLDRRRLMLLLYAGGCVAFACIFFYTSPRLMLPILPVCYAWVGHSLFGLTSNQPVGWGPVRFRRELPLAAMFWLVTFASTAREVPTFVASHPIEEVRAMVQMEEDYGSHITVLTTAPYYGRHVHYECRHLPVPPRQAASHPRAYSDYLQTMVGGVDFVVIGRLTGRGVPVPLIAGTGVPDYLEPIRVTHDVAIYRVRSRASAH